MSLEVDIRKRLGAFRLDVSFASDGDVVALLGASGCGKSMTLKCVAGIETPDSGRIVLNGRVLYDSEKHINLSPQKRRVGYLFQQYALFPNMTVAGNIAAGVRNGSRAEKREAVEAQLRAFRLEGKGDKRPRELSGGEQQRVALARILANRPEALLLDEPFAALDGYLKWQLELELADTLRAFGGNVVYVSHSRDEVYRLCDTVCVLTEGRSSPKCRMRELFSSPGTVSAALLSGCKNISRAERLGARALRCEDWGVTLRMGCDVPEDAGAAGIRAHYLTIAPQDGENVIPCGVERVIDDVFSTVVMLSTPGGRAGRSLLRMELSKEAWAAQGNPRSLLIRVAPDDVMALRGGVGHD